MTTTQTDSNEPTSTPAASNPSCAPPESATISEQQFMRDHTLYSAASSWLFAIAGATNIGVLCALSSKILMATQEGKPIFRAPKNAASIPVTLLTGATESGAPIYKTIMQAPAEPVMANKRYNLIALGMTAFGAVCMGISNWLESRKLVLESQMLAGKTKKAMAFEGARAKMMGMLSGNEPTPAERAHTRESAESLLQAHKGDAALEQKVRELAQAAGVNIPAHQPEPPMVPSELVRETQSVSPAAGVSQPILAA